MSRTQQLESLRRKVQRWQVPNMREAYMEMDWLIKELDAARAMMRRAIVALPRGSIERAEMERIIE